MVELFIARRYLQAKRKQVMISVITVISVIGVASGVMALVIALAITTGSRNAFERSFLGVLSHVMLLDQEGMGIANWREMEQKLAAIDGVAHVNAALYDGGLISGPVNNTFVEIKGIPIRSQDALPGPLQKLKQGSIDGLRPGGDPPGIVLGIQLARKIGAGVGSDVKFLAPNAIPSPIGARAKETRLRVTGLMQTGMFNVDESWAYVSLEDAQRLFNIGDLVNSVELTLDDVYRAGDVARQADAMVDPQIKATTWQEQNQSILAAFRMERIVTAVAVGLIELVAGLNILITLVMMVMEKHRDIAILMSMGARAAQIRNIFVLKGAIIGAIGTVIGLVLGYALSFLADRYQWLKIDEQVYALAYVPLEPRWVDAIWIAAAAMGVSLLATLYPAHSATRIQPVDSMRYE